VLGCALAAAQSELEPAMGARMLRFVEKANERADLARVDFAFSA